LINFQLGQLVEVSIDFMAHGNFAHDQLREANGTVEVLVAHKLASVKVSLHFPLAMAQE
jgi:hypothetical protein